MRLLNKQLPVAAVVACVFFLILSSQLTASASGFQGETVAPTVAPYDLKPYAGTWHWLFQGKPFVTIVLVPAGDHFTGMMTNGSFTTDKAGNMTAAGAEPGGSRITRTFFAGNILHIIVADAMAKSTSEFSMTVISSGKAEFNAVTNDRVTLPWPAEHVADAVLPLVNPANREMTPPRIIHSVDPKYPPGENKVGMCVLGFIVDPAGDPQDIHVTRSFSPRFDQNAIESVRQFKFKPAMFRGKPVPVQISIQVQFTPH